MGSAKEVLVTFRCDEKFAEVMQRAAWEREMSKSDFIRTAVELFMCFPPDRESIRERGEFYRKILVLLDKI